MLADVTEALRQGDRRGRLPLAGLGGRDRRDADELRVGPGREPVEHREVDLRLVAPVELDLVGLDSCLGGDLRYRPELGALRDLEGRGELHLHRTVLSYSSEMRLIYLCGADHNKLRVAGREGVPRSSRHDRLARAATGRRGERTRADGAACDRADADARGAAPPGAREVHRGVPAA